MDINTISEIMGERNIPNVASKIKDGKDKNPEKYIALFETKSFFIHS